jgi:hypothetical protein
VVDGNNDRVYLARGVNVDGLNGNKRPVHKTSFKIDVDNEHHQTDDYSSLYLIEIQVLEPSWKSPMAAAFVRMSMVWIADSSNVFEIMRLLHVLTSSL